MLSQLNTHKISNKASHADLHCVACLCAGSTTQSTTLRHMLAALHHKIGRTMKYTFAAIIALMSMSAVSADIKTNSYNEISEIALHSKTDALTVEWSGVTVVYTANNIEWNKETSCSGSLVLIKEDDSHILSAVLAAKMAQKRVKFYSFDNTNIGGNLCFLRAVGIEA